jgi:hypothetical protein
MLAQHSDSAGKRYKDESVRLVTVKVQRNGTDIARASWRQL